MIFKCKYGTIKENYLFLSKLNNEMIILSTIAEVKINKKHTSDLKFINFFKKKQYDFSILMDNRKEITFSFNKIHLSKVLAFKTRIFHAKFSIQESIIEKTSDNLEIKNRS